MDTLDKLTRSAADPEAFPDADMAPSSLETLADSDVHQDANEDKANDVIKEAPLRRFGGWKLFAAGVVVAAAAVGGYAYWRSLQQRPKTRLERFKERLGLNNLDLTSAPSALRSVDYDQLHRTGRDLGRLAKKKVHVGARTVAELTR